MAHTESRSTAEDQPQSTLALNFSAALDDVFKLSPLDALQESVEQKKDRVQSQQNQLSDLDQQLREADEKLKKLEIKWRRMSQMYATRRPVRTYPGDEREDETSGDSDGQANETLQRDE